MDDEAGGTAKEYAWEGIPYSNSAAYFYLGDADHPDMRLYRDIGVLDEVCVPAGKEKDSVFIRDRLCPDFFKEGRGDARETAALRALSAWFAHLLEEAMPDVPFDPKGPYTRREFTRLDNLSFGAFVDGRGSVTYRGKTARLPQAPTIYREFIENYCFSSFGSSADGISAWQGINWFCSEFEVKGVGVVPGGNGRITTRLLEKIAKIDPSCVCTSMPVVDVRHDPRSRMNEVTVALRKGTTTAGYRTFAAKYVIFCTPCFVTKRILLQELPERLRRAIERFGWSGYIVANAFVNDSILDGFWDTYCLNDYRNPGKSADLYRKQPFMDIINAAWCLRKAGRAPAGKTVLTIYCPHPFDGQREDLLSDEYCASFGRRLKDGLVRRLAPQGLSESKIVDIRIARWGHAMFQAKQGILSGGVLDEIQASVASKGMFFAGTEFAGAPTIENCHLTAREASAKVAARIRGKIS
jgi:hypothetical protein